MTAPSLRDSIARSLLGMYGPVVTYGPGGETHSDVTWAYEAADLVLAALADTDPTDLGLERVGFVWTSSQGIQWGGPEGTGHRTERPVYARPRTEEAHTVDVGFVHVLTEDGACTPACPHPDHRTEETP